MSLISCFCLKVIFKLFLIRSHRLYSLRVIFKQFFIQSHYLQSHSWKCVIVIFRHKSHGYYGAYYAPRVAVYRGYYGHGYGSKYTRQLIDFHPVPWPKIIWNQWGDQYHNLFFYVSSSCKCTVNKIKPYFSYPQPYCNN